MKLLLTLPLFLLRRLLRSGIAALGVLLILYFTLFALEGDRGYASLQTTQLQVQEAEAKLAQVKGEREAVERKVMALRPSSIDGDMLDEQVRTSLGYVKPNEIVILGR